MKTFTQVVSELGEELPESDEEFGKRVRALLYSEEQRGFWADKVMEKSYYYCPKEYRFLGGVSDTALMWYKPMLMTLTASKLQDLWRTLKGKADETERRSTRDSKKQKL